MKGADRIEDCWKHLFPEISGVIPDNFIKSLSCYRQTESIDPENKEWYKEAIVYSLYVDLFNKNFNGLREKLPYLQELGVNCLWLLPVLDSPGRDAGFDISDYYSIRKDLTEPEQGQDGFNDFIAEAHKRDIKVIFDIALNHTSDQHPWFKESRKSKDNYYRHYYIWSDDIDKYSGSRIIFKGIEKSNWEKDKNGYYFHRFFNFQPDLNYRNPEVLFAICRVLLYWQKVGVDGFRVDAIPYLWKDEGTDCENRPQTHFIIKFMRAVLDYCKPGTILLAEACQLPEKVVEYFGDGDECHAAYNFPLMPRIFTSIAEQDGKSIKSLLNPDVTPVIPLNSQWFTFLRCHDELSLELEYISEEERRFIYQNYCHKKEWDFRQGEGISARLTELMQKDTGKVLLAFSILFTLPGTPVIYYGDEFGKLNDPDYYREAIQLTGKDDTRYYCRGRIDWEWLDSELQNHDSMHYKIYNMLKKMISVKKRFKLFGRGNLIFQDADPRILSYSREYLNDKFLFIHNLSDKEMSYMMPKGNDMLEQQTGVNLEARGFRWIRIQE